MQTPPSTTAVRTMASRGREVHVFDNLRGLPEDVVALFEKAARHSPELSLEWFQNLVDNVFPDDRGVQLAVLRREGRTVAALPLRRIPTRLGAKIESLTNYYSAFFAPVLDEHADGDDLTLLLRAVRRSSPGAASIRMAPMDPEHRAFDMVMRACDRAGWHAFRFYCFGNWYLPVENDWAAYLKTRSGTLRNTIKRLGKRLIADGGSMEIIEAGPDLARAIDAFQQVYAASWKGAEPYPDFVPGLARRAAERGWLRLGVAWLGSKPIAAQIWLVAHGRAEIYKVAYHQDYQVYSPGTLVTALLMERVIDTDKAKEVDYLIGDDAYKKNWMTVRRERWGIIAYNRWSPWGMLGLLREWAGKIYRRLRPLAPATDKPAAPGPATASHPTQGQGPQIGN